MALKDQYNNTNTGHACMLTLNRLRGGSQGRSVLMPVYDVWYEKIQHGGGDILLPPDSLFR